MLKKRLETLIQAYCINEAGLLNAIACFENIGGLPAYNRLAPCFRAFVKHKGALYLMLAICAKHFSKSENYASARDFLKSTAERFMNYDCVRLVLSRRNDDKSHNDLWHVPAVLAVSPIFRPPVFCKNPARKVGWTKK